MQTGTLQKMNKTSANGFNFTPIIHKSSNPEVGSGFIQSSLRGFSTHRVAETAMKMP